MDGLLICNGRNVVALVEANNRSALVVLVVVAVVIMQRINSSVG